MYLLTVVCDNFKLLANSSTVILGLKISKIRIKKIRTNSPEKSVIVIFYLSNLFVNKTMSKE